MHNSLGLGEHFYQHLHNTFHKISLTQAHVSKELQLAMTVKEINNTLGTEGVVPSALVFSKYPQIRAPGTGILPRPDLAERAKIAEEARKK